MGVNYAVIPVTEELELTANFSRGFLQSEEDEAEDPTQGELADAIRARQIPAWLSEFGIAYASLEKTGRYPTPAEIVQILAGADLIEANYPSGKTEGFSGVLITDEYLTGTTSTVLNVVEFSGNSHRPHRIWFEKGSPWLILYLTEKLTHVCGPLIVVPDDSEIPVLVRPGDDETELMEAWEDA